MADWMPPPLPEPDVIVHYTADQMRARDAEVARAALEQAALLCDEKARRNFPWGSENSDLYHAQADWAEQCASAIRGLAKEIT